MKLYCIIPTINCIDLTQQAINSIKTSVSHKVILIDNASEDDTQSWGQQQMKLFEEAPDIHTPIQYIRNEPRRGVAASWNQGIKIALEDNECEYIAVLNNDIILHPKTLDHLMAFMDKTRYLMVTADNIADRMSPETLLKLELPQQYTDYDCAEITDWRAEGPDFSCYMISRATIETIGFFDENFIGAYCEDQDYHARIERARRWGVQYGNPDPSITHAKRLSTAPYYHFASQTVKENANLRAEVSKNHAHNRNYYVEKWGGEHPHVMDGYGNMQPFGDATKNWKMW